MAVILSRQSWDLQTFSRGKNANIEETVRNFLAFTRNICIPDNRTDTFHNTRNLHDEIFEIFPQPTTQTREKQIYK